MKIVIVEWVDARFLEGWQDKHHFDLDIIKCVTVGVIHKETDDAIIVCHHRNEDSVSGCMAIPKSSIKRIRKLKIKEE